MSQEMPPGPTRATGSPPTFGAAGTGYDDALDRTITAPPPADADRYDTSVSGTSDGSSESGSTGGVVDTARGEAAEVGRSAAEAGSQVAGTAADQAKEVASEIRDQARDLLGEGRAQLREQAGTGQRKAADGVDAMARELRAMADRGDGGLPTELARQGADRLQALASWLQRREPGDLLEEVRGWARDHPGTFLVGAAVAGVVAGRLTSGAVAARRDTAGSDTDAMGVTEPAGMPYPGTQGVSVPGGTGQVPR